MSETIRDTRFWIAAIFAQVCFYVLAIPVPQRLGNQSFSFGVLVCIVSALTLAVLPLLIVRLGRRFSNQLHVRILQGRILV